MSKLSQLLFGRDAFASVHTILEELPLEAVGERPASLPHSIFEELWHVDYWQQRLLARLRGETPAESEDGADWPSAPAPPAPQEWQDLLERLMRGLDEAAGVGAEADVTNRKLGDDRTVRDVVQDLAVHNAYHFGRIVALRQALGIWPPRRS